MGNSDILIKSDGTIDGTEIIHIPTGKKLETNQVDEEIQSLIDKLIEKATYTFNTR